MARPLFRKEAVDAQREKFLGEITGIRPIPLWFFTVLVVGIAAALIALAVWGQYTRRERVQGFLASETGSVPILISDAGQVKELEVAEGESVVAGQVLARVSIDRSQSGSAASSGAVLEQIAQRRSMLAQERGDTEDLGQKQIEQSRQKVMDLQNELSAADREIALQKLRLKSSHDILDRYENLFKDHYISDVALQQKRDDMTDQEIKLATLLRERASLEKDLSAAELEEPSLKLRTLTQLKEIDRQISELDQSSVEQRVLNETLLKAPVAGTVTNITVVKGQVVAAATPFATIVPKDATLHAELIVPTRAIGFVHSGQRVQLRYEAFPYERFGQYGGVVDTVGKTAWVQGEKVGPLEVREPAYRIVVKLDQQTVQTGSGQALNLRSGMLVSADLLMEKRTLLEWLFQPVLQLKERLQ